MNFDNLSLEQAIKKARTERKAIHKNISIVGFKTPEGKELMKAEVELYRAFAAKYGEDELLTMQIGKPSKSPVGKLQNSKGYGYGNLSM